MTNLPKYVSAYTDRHGHRRYRFRRKGISRPLPGEPASAAFQAAYAAALAGTPPVKKNALAATPRTLRGAWIEVQRAVEWRQLRPISRKHQTGVANRFLALPIAPGEQTAFGDMPMAGIRRGDVKKILSRYADRPHAGEAVLRLLRKLALTALDLEWIENDPTYRVKFKPKLVGHRAWTDDELAAFARHWPVGTKQRLGFALALYTGQRRADVAAMTWAAFDGTGIAVKQEKTGEALWIPAHPELRAVLTATQRAAPAILGRTYTPCGFGNLMAEAITAAGLSDACRLHGLRKSAGRCLAEGGATTKQIMAILGHKTLSEAERYTKEAEQRSLAQQGIDQWAKPRLVVSNG